MKIKWNSDYKGMIVVLSLIQYLDSVKNDMYLQKGFDPIVYFKHAEFFLIIFVRR